LGGAPLGSVWPCSGRGLPCHRMLPSCAVSSYLTFSPLPALRELKISLPLAVSYLTFSPLPALRELKSLLAAGGLFSVALSRDYSLRALPGVLPCGARTFLPGRSLFKDLPEQPPLKPYPLFKF